MVTPDRDNWTYKTGETATFTIQVYKAQCLLKGAVIDYEQTGIERQAFQARILSREGDGKG